MERLSRVISVVQEANFKEHLWKSDVFTLESDNREALDHHLWIKWVVGHIDLTFCHIDPLCQKSDVSLVVNLSERNQLEQPMKLIS